MATWEQNKDFIVSQVQTGKATPGQIDWYNRWVASGAPESQTGMVAGVQTGPQIGFGDSYVGPVSQPTPTDPGMLTPTTTTTTDAPDVTATESPVTPTQDELLNQNFINLLAQLGLANLVAGFGGQTQQEPATVPQGMLSNQFGVVPQRQGYLPPLVVQPSSIAQDTGLLQYIVNQGQ